jgi:hypothetical protein
MGPETPGNNIEPDTRIEDHDKAEAMAYATKTYEEALVSMEKQAQNHRDLAETKTTQGAKKKDLERARKVDERSAVNRQFTDRAAEEAGRCYDQANG